MKIVIFLFVILFICSRNLLAHPLKHSEVELDIRLDKIIATIRTPMSDFQNSINEDMRHKNLSELQGNNEKYINYIKSHILINDGDNNKWSINNTNRVSFEDFDKRIPDIVFSFEFIPDKFISKKINLSFDFLFDKNFNHKIFIVLKSDWQNGVFENEKKLITVLNNKSYQFEINREEASNRLGFKSTFLLGIKHIYEGFDHILFIIMLILPLGLTIKNKNWGEASEKNAVILKSLKLISAFAIGHTFSLFLGGLNILNISSQVVEPLIAISILITSIHAIKPFINKFEFWITLFFGVIHGFAFSEIIIQLHLPFKFLALSVLMFNLGIEVMQILILTLILPPIIILSKYSKFKLIKNVTAVLGSIIAFYLLIIRIINQ